MHHLADQEIDALSIGGLDTCIQLPRWKLCFDIGHCPQSALKLPRVLFTHAHCDHMGGVIHHVSGRDLMGMAPPEYVIPVQNEAAFEQLINAWRQLDRSTLPCVVKAVKPGDVVPLGKTTHAKVFQVLHRVPSVGYALCSTKHKLKPEYAHLEGPAIGKLRTEGVAITEEHETVEVAFCGDTLIDVVEREELVRTARLLILECTFIDDRVPVEKARAMGHIHLDEIIERAHLFANDRILLTHFSARYRSSEIRRVLEERLPESIRYRVVPNLDGHPG